MHTRNIAKYIHKILCCNVTNTTQEKVLVTVDRFIGIPLQQKAEKFPRVCRVTRKELKNIIYDIPERCDGFSSQTIPLLQFKSKKY